MIEVIEWPRFMTEREFTMFEFELDTSEKVRRRIRYLIQTEYDGAAGFFRHIYDKDPSEEEIKRFEMFLRRGSMNIEFMDLLSQKTKIGEVSLHRLFDTNVNNEELFSD